MCFLASAVSILDIKSTMPASIRLAHLSTIIFHSHKFLSTVSTTVDSKPILRIGYIQTRRRTVPGARPAHVVHSSRNFRNFQYCTAGFRSRGQNRRFSRDNNESSRMGATANGYDSDVSPPQNHREKPPTKLLTLPNILTIGRVVAVPLLVGAFYVEGWWGPTLTTGIFIAAAITDWLDGYLARKMKSGTPFGAFLDPVADKLMVATALILLCTRPLEAGGFGQVPWLLNVPAIAIIGREITMSAVREWAASQDKKLLEAVAVNNLGKWKTATQMTALTILLAVRDESLAGAGALVSSGVALLYISAWLSMWSLFVYVRKIGKVLLK